jgi:terminase small subunit-like protein
MSSAVARIDATDALADAAHARWDKFIAAIKEGLPTDKAMMHCGIARREFELAVMHPDANRQWRDATLAAKKNTWSILDRDEVFARIARGVKIEKAITEVRGFDDPTLFDLIEGDTDVHEQYMAAMKARSLREMDKLLDIADDDTKDVLSGPKGDIPNMAAVNRSRLMVETRKELAGNFWPKLFGAEKGTQVNIQINNHAQTLEEARERARNRGGADGVKKISKDEMAQAVNATFAETPVPTKAERAMIDAAFKPVEPKPMKSAPVAEPATGDPLEE